MAQMSFGTILRSERERLGLDITAVAAKLRIRPDIIRAIEASNFDHMPPRGYARNMVHAYARVLGLDPTEITNLYLSEASAFQRNSDHGEAPFRNLNYTQDPGTRRVAPAQQESGYERSPYTNGPQRTLYVEDRDRSYRYNESERQPYPGDRTRRSSRSGMPTPQYSNSYDGSGVVGTIISKLPIIIVCIIVLVIIIFLLVFFLGGRNSSSNDLPNVPVSGVTDGQANTPIAQAPPTKTVFKFEATDGHNPWVDIYVNDAHVTGGFLSDLTQTSYDVTETLRLDTADPDGIKAYQDNNPVSLSDPDGDGIWSVTISYPEALAQWYRDNPTTTATTGDSTGTTGTAGDASATTTG